MSIRNKLVNSAQIVVVGTSVAAQLAVTCAIAPAALICVAGGTLINGLGTIATKAVVKLESMKEPEVINA